MGKRPIAIAIGAVVIILAVLVLSQRQPDSGFGAVGTQQPAGPEPGDAIPPAGPGPQTDSIPTYTLADVSSHDSQSDCWLALSGKVYDVTDFISSHPGGQAILEGCGTDATDLYETRPMGSGTPHSQRARSLLENYYIGDLA